MSQKPKVAFVCVHNSCAARWQKPLPKRTMPISLKPIRRNRDQATNQPRCRPHHERKVWHRHGDRPVFQTGGGIASH